MPIELPRRPGFAAGTEEKVWEGGPALRSTVYFWAISIAAAWFIHIFWSKLFVALLAGGMLPNAPGLYDLLFSAKGGLRTWLIAVPWVFCLFPPFWYMLNLAFTTYELSTQRLTIRTGILIRTMDQLELFRVRDFMIDTPIHLNLLGLSHVRIISRDESLPILTLIAQNNPDLLVDLVRDKMQRRKDEVGTREIETNTA